VSHPPAITIAYPDWVHTDVDFNRAYTTDQERMALAVEVSRLNVVHRTGGPFGAGIFERHTGKLVAVGMNSVVRLNNCTLHGEMVAFMMAQARLQSFTLRLSDDNPHELFTSCDPCAMCLGATLWSGVKRMVCGADRLDAQRLNFDEGPVFPQSMDYLRERGIEIVTGYMRKEANDVLELYRHNKGIIYNG
jgi:tRNA(Arg) A34 adenosine deaminase TadA